ncbi:hypothetical protein D3C81_1549220 [compost metagenome]
MGAGQAAQTLFAAGAVASLLVAGRAGRLGGLTRGIGGHAGGGQFVAQAGDGFGGGFDALRGLQRRLGLDDFAVQPGDGLVQSLSAGLTPGLVAHQALDHVAAGGHGLVDGEGFEAGGLHRLLGSAEGFGRRLLSRLRGLQRGLARVDLGFQLGQSRALGQTHGGGTRRLGAADEAVPAIEVALDRHQAGAWRQ